METEEQALQIFLGPAQDIKNLIVLTRSFNKTFNIFMSGVFDRKIMTKREQSIHSESSNLNLGEMFKSKFTNMKGYTYRVAALPYAPFLMKK